MATTKANELSQFAKTLTVDASGNTTLTGNVTAPSIANTGGGTFVDSDAVVGLVDSDHVQARANADYIKGIADSAYIDTVIAGASITDLSDADQTVRTTDDVSFGTVTLTGTLDGPSTFYIDPAPVDSDAGLLVIRGDLQVDGTTTTVNSQTVTINDKNIVLADSASNASEADGAGITVEGASATITYDATADAWDFNKDVDVTGTVTMDGGSTSADFSFGDNDKAIFGAGNDLQIYHDGSQSIIADTGTGQLLLKGENTIAFSNASGTETYASMVKDGAVTLKYNNNTKFATTNTGIDVTGTVTADDVTVTDTSPLVDVKGDGDGFPTLKIRRVNGVTKDNQSYYYRVTSGGSLILTDETDSNKTRMEVFQSGNISFYDSTGTTQGLHWDASTQRLGLGTTSPARVLHLQSSSGGGMLSVERTSATTSAFVVAADSGAVNLFARDTNSGSGNVDFGFSTGTTRRMTITSGGNVGIGNTIPGSFYDGADNLVVGDGSGNSGISLYGGTSGVNRIYFADGTSGAERYDGYIEYSHSNRRMLFGSAAATQMVISSSGNLGLGTNSPDAKLHVSSGTSGDAKIIVSADTDNSNENDNPSIELKQDGNGVIAKFGIEGEAGNTFSTSLVNAAYIGHETAQPLQFITNNVARMTITSAGNVGIGTTSPNAKLQVNGAVEIVNNTGLFIKTSTNGSSADIKFSDNVSSYSQVGTLSYRHSDGAVTTVGGNSNDGFIFSGTEPRTVVKVEGDIVATGKIYEGSTGVATTGKAVVMAMLFG